MGVTRSLEVENNHCREQNLSFSQTGQCILKSIDPKTCQNVQFSNDPNLSGAIRINMNEDWTKFSDRQKENYQFVTSIPKEEIADFVKCLEAGLKPANENENTTNVLGYQFSDETIAKFKRYRTIAEAILILAPTALGARIIGRFAPQVLTAAQNLAAREGLIGVTSRFLATSAGRGFAVGGAHLAADPESFTDISFAGVQEWIDGPENTAVTIGTLIVVFGAIIAVEKRLDHHTAELVAQQIFGIGLAGHHIHVQHGLIDREDPSIGLTEQLLAGMEARENAVITGAVACISGTSMVLDYLIDGSRFAAYVCVTDDGLPGAHSLKEKINESLGR